MSNGARSLPDSAAVDGGAIEQQEAAARAALQKWQATSGALLNNVLAELRNYN